MKPDEENLRTLIAAGKPIFTLPQIVEYMCVDGGFKPEDICDFFIDDNFNVVEYNVIVKMYDARLERYTKQICVTYQSHIEEYFASQQPSNISDK